MRTVTVARLARRYNSAVLNALLQIEPIVSEDFDGKNLLARHRMINEILADELQNKIHALALHTYTSEEWTAQNGSAPMSPPCQGGGKG